MVIGITPFIHVPELFNDQVISDQVLSREEECGEQERVHRYGNHGGEDENSEDACS